MEIVLIVVAIIPSRIVASTKIKNVSTQKRNFYMRKIIREREIQIPINANDHQKRGKWAPQNEAKNKNHGPHNIDGKEYYYHYKYKHWKTMDNPTPPTGNSSPPAADVITSLSSSGYVTTSGGTQSQEVALVTTTKHISETLCGISSLFKLL